MDIDKLVKKLLSWQTLAFPDDDPGDISIEYQDDMPLVTATQNGVIGFGTSAAWAVKDLASRQGFNLDK